MQRTSCFANSCLTAPWMQPYQPTVTRSFLNNKSMLPSRVAVCFHGCGQNAELFRRLIKPLKLSTYGIDRVIYMQGFYRIDEGSRYSWYPGVTHTSSAETAYGSGEPHTDMERMYQRLTQHAEVILIGFSQGALFACDLQTRFGDRPDNPVRGVLAISPPYFRDDMLETVVACPLHVVVSMEDHVVDPEVSKRWTRNFTPCQTWVTDKRGHKVHFSAALRRLLTPLLEPDPVKLFHEQLKVHAAAHAKLEWASSSDTDSYYDSECSYLESWEEW
jgi:predicted esterase